jgi:hypothetical protein
MGNAGFQVVRVDRGAGFYVIGMDVHTVLVGCMMSRQQYGM